MIDPTEKHYDIIALGSGLAGASFLLLLAQTFLKHPNLPLLKIAVIDKQTVVCHRETSRQDARAIALSHTSVETLKEMKVWHLLEKQASPIEAVHVTSKGHFGRTCLQASHYQLKNLGVVIDADLLNVILNQALPPGPANDRMNEFYLDRYQPDEIKTCHYLALNQSENQEEVQGKWHIELVSGKRMTATLLMGADGTESYLRKRCGVEAVTQEYAEMAMVSNVCLEESHQNVAYERFLNQGDELCSLALLPFGEQRMKSVLVASSTAAASLMTMTEKEYLRVLQKNFGYSLGRFKEIGKRFTYPLKSLKSESLYGPGWVLVGNAANTLHPLAAQGFNLGLRDVSLLKEVIFQALKNKQNIGAPCVLQQYAAGRSKDHFYTCLFTETLVKEKKWLPWGIILSEFIPALKKRIFQQGLGANV